MCRYMSLYVAICYYKNHQIFLMIFCRFLEKISWSWKTEFLEIPNIKKLGVTWSGDPMICPRLSEIFLMMCQRTNRSSLSAWMHICEDFLMTLTLHLARGRRTNLNYYSVRQDPGKAWKSKLHKNTHPATVGLKETPATATSPKHG